MDFLAGECLKSWGNPFNQCLGEAKNIVGDWGVDKSHEGGQKIRGGVLACGVLLRGVPLKTADKKLAAIFDLPEVQNYLLNQRIQWRYNFPKASWWGGLFERLVGMIKRCLKKIICNARLSYDELLTAVTEVEGILNSRPLTYVQSDDIEEVLTPSHLLTGRKLVTLPVIIELQI